MKSLILSVPVRWKIAGMMMLPILILGFGLNYWVRTGLSDWLSYLLSNERVRIALEAGSRSVMFVTILAALISVFLTILLMIVFTRPILELGQVAQRVRDGDFSSRATIFANDEIGEVCLAINQMLDQLISGQEELQQINHRLNSMNQVAMTTSRALGLPDVLDAALKTTLSVMHLESGWIYLRDTIDLGDEKFHLMNYVGLNGKVDQLLKRPPDGLCICQESLLKDTLGESASVRTCYRLQEEGGEEENLPCHITIPLSARDQHFGVINLLVENGIDVQKNDLDLLSSIGAHVSEIVANAWLHDRLSEKEAIRQTLLEALVKAEEGERAHLARELHDGAGQHLTNLLIRLKRLEKHAQDQKLKTDIANLCDSVSDTIVQIRGISHNLRPPELEEFGLEVAIRSLVQEMCAISEINAHFRLELNGKRLPFETETTIYRIAQECMTNVIRHANATIIEVALETLPLAVGFSMQDNGVGFLSEELPESLEKRRLGLLGMTERAQMQGGSLKIFSSPGEGTSVNVRIPIDWEKKI